MSTVSDLQLRLSRITTTATLPRYATPGSAALDLYADEAVLLYPGERRVVATNIAVELPPGYEAQVRGRSGLARKGCDVVLGTVDSDYRGGIGVICVNNGSADDLAYCKHCGSGLAVHLGERPWFMTDIAPSHVFEPSGVWAISPGDRVAQLVIAPVARVTTVEVPHAELSETERGAGGFGSSGVR